MRARVNERKPAPVRLADASNPTFRPLHTALDKRYCELHTQGVGTKRKQAEVVSNHEEQQLWERGVLSSESPSGLLRAVLYLNGINFVLRGGEEYRSLKISQLPFLMFQIQTTLNAALSMLSTAQRIGQGEATRSTKIIKL